MLTRIALSLAALLLLGGCDPARLYANASDEGNRLWAGWVGYDAEQWVVRQTARRQCLERAINPGIDRLLAEGRIVDATKVWQANYPGVTYFNVLDDAARGRLLEALSKMPACRWPKDVVLDPPAAGSTAALPMGPVMLTPVAPN